MATTTETFGARVKRLREERKITSASDLDELAGLSRGHTWLIESGERGKSPSANTARKLASALGVTLDELLEGTETAA